MRRNSGSSRHPDAAMNNSPSPFTGRVGGGGFSFVGDQRLAIVGTATLRHPPQSPRETGGSDAQVGKLTD